MPWSEVTRMDERLQFVADVRRGVDEMAVLCRRYGVSRKTGYKWLARYAEAAHRPHTCPHATAPDAADALYELRRRHPTWGPKKLLTILAARRPALALPAPSTAAALLKRAGLVTAPRRRRTPGHPGRPTAPMDAPNAIWTADFKGEFKTRDGIYCYPLTVADGYSRYLLACRALPSTATAGARPVFAQLFREYGLPARIRSDNGVPCGCGSASCRTSSSRGARRRTGGTSACTRHSRPRRRGRPKRTRGRSSAASTHSARSTTASGRTRRSAR
jgi:putative transposase